MNRKKNLKRNLLICLLAGSAVMYTLPLYAATSVIANNTLPSGGQFVHGEGNIASSGLEMNITQNGQNAVIKWNDFSVGGNATVNFDYTGKDNFNTLNYVNSGKVSQIYGTINAQHEGYNGNIFIVNTAGVQIGPSAQINVGSLHVSSNTLDNNALKNFYDNAHNADFALEGTRNTDAALMSLGNINATNVTFEGDGRIVIDSERIKDAAGDEKLNYQNINIKTSETNKNNIIIGYEAYDETITNGSVVGYDNKNTDEVIATVTTENGTSQYTKANGYMWVEDVEQLQAINTNLSGNYALRNSIDATSTEQQGNEFSSIGITSDGNVDNNGEGFTGKFDGLDYSIFDLNIDETGNNNVGLFGYTTDATISNVTLVGGSIRGNNNVGAVVGNANNTTVTNALNSAAVSGNRNVGGIVGSATDTTVEDAINTGAIEGRVNTDDGGINVGGLIGSMNNSHLIGNSYNLGDVTSIGSNVGGLVGSATNSVIGNKADTDTEETELVYNRMDVTGAYNVGGIVGNMVGSTVRNAENSGTVTAERYTTEKYNYHTANGGTHIESVDVNVANVGGIAGISSNSTITNVENSGDVSTETIGETGDDINIYRAGNVGGVVGSAVDTNITNATNKENSVRGAHNVGGIAGYFSGTGTINKGINDGGNIMATGARYGGNFVRETVRPITGDANESFIIGNIGGIVGYMEGNGAKVTGSANRGTVHTDEPGDPTNVEEWQKAANVGGVVGKIDRSDTVTINAGNVNNAAVSNSYNTGDVLGYTGVGGVAGMMYNGEIAASYNLGYLRTTRQSQQGSSIDALNMGGIVGDTTELSGAKVYLYDVYNKGQIGDSEFNYFGRHVGGIVGRLSGTVEKAYNNGAIYNGYNVVGGIAGWMAQGKIENAFNTGNITVLNKNNASSQVGGIAGAASDNNAIVINNAYNLGTLRSFKDSNVANAGNNTLGGILGHIQDENQGNASVTITNVYTTGNLFIDEGNGIGSIYGSNTIGTRLNVRKAYYIRPQEGLGFTDLYGTAQNNATGSKLFVDKDQWASDAFEGGITKPSKTSPSKTSGDVDEDSAWRIYGGNTPILNAFLPKAEDYFSGESGYSNTMNGIDSIQYGTAYDPLLTIIKADDEYLTANNLTALTYNWSDLGISNAAGLVVYGAGLTLDNVNTSGGSGYFGGTIYADGALNLNGGTNDIGLGSAADIYGSAVNITTGGKVTIYGDVTATGNTANGATSDKSDVIDVKDKGNITISASDVDVYGTLTSAEQGSSVVVSGIEDQAVQGWKPGLDIGDEEEVMSDIADRFAHTTGASDVYGNITIIAKTKLVVDDNDEPILDENGNKQYIGGNVNLYYGNKEQGLITTGGNLTVTGTGDVYVDSDLEIGGDLTLTGTGADSEVVLDITNIGQVQAKNGTVTDAVTGLHNFMHHFSDVNGDGANIYLNAEQSKDTKITVDMWNGNAFDLKKFDSENHDFKKELNSMNVTINDKILDDKEGNHVKDYTYIWVSDGEQLQGINATVNDGGLDFNYALKGDINASGVTDYKAIGTGSDTGFTGTFDGRGNRIIGLTVDKVDGKDTANAGIFDTIGTNGVVKDVNIYSGNFTGSANAGAVAGKNNGRIEGIVTFGNTVTVTGNNGNAGGIVGINNAVNGKIVTNEDGTITLEPVDRNKPVTGIIDVESTGSVIAGNTNAIAGGLVGTNNGTLGNSYSNSAVTANAGTAAGLGGVVGVNTEKGNVQYVDSLGVTNGGAHLSNNVGGIIGINNGNMYSGFNESIVSGKDKVGGIIGNNTGTVTNIVNASSVDGFDTENASGTMAESNYVGGLVGSNSGSVTNGRNNGTITGTNYVGGMVGSNGENSILTNLVNDNSAAITGEQYVGGIAGDNAGTITTGNEETDENVNLINRGTITGQQYVGGVAGSNSGIITNANNDVELNVKDSTADAEFFGGIAGENTEKGIINNATNTADVNADGATYVGGIVGENNGTLKDMAGNSGNVTGKDYVGGVAGKNNAVNNDPLNGVEASNTGTVFATGGGAGGIFAVNNANITNSKLTNNGTVIGNSGNGTGGIFGVNTGNISTSSLKNEVDGQVIGMNNVGGLIGVNTGNITGGRDDADSYYKYKIYNNGVINVGTYIYNNKNGEYEFQVDTGSNIGGLIGNNADETAMGGKKGSLTAGYNTGAINAAGSENVGGIAGSNSGKIDQVFNTVITADGKNTGTITGGTNVGGLVGNNSGTLSNAYNTTGVTGDDKFGNAVGNNTGEITNIYASNTTGILIGACYENGKVYNAYSFVSDDKSATGVITGDAQKDSDSYEGFDFDTDGSGIWKNYDGYSNPLLKVFLTKAYYDSATGQLVAAADDFKAHQNAEGGLIFQGGLNNLWSIQIRFGNGNPNWLGYDLEGITYMPDENWYYFLDDAPFDRNRDFRERKAEVNFVDGGMEI